MLVTSFYEIYGKPERIPQYFKWFEPLGYSGLSMIVFTEPEFIHLFDKYPVTVRVIPLSLKGLELYQIGMKYDRDLPAYRTPEKDTQEFLSLMNTKIELLKHAAIHCDDDTLIWIDFGIFKIMKTPKKVLAKLFQLTHLSFHKIVIPGCNTYLQHGCYPDRVNWRFCGGFFVMPRSHLSTFYQHSKNVLSSFCEDPQYKLTWEVNVWYIIEQCTNRENMVWYYAGHEDTIVLNIENVLHECIPDE